MSNQTANRTALTFFSDPPLAWLDRQVCNPQIPTVTSLLLLLLFWVFHIGTLQTFCNLCLSALHADINRLYAKRTLANLLTGNNTRAIWRYTELVSQLAADSPVELPFVFSGKSASRRWFLLWVVNPGFWSFVFNFSPDRSEANQDRRLGNQDVEPSGVQRSKSRRELVLCFG